SMRWERITQAARLEQDVVVVFDVDAQNVSISRYGAFRLFPKARYSAGIIRLRDVTKITVMRNPWLDFTCPHLGGIAERFGGGGHRRIGSINLRGDQVASAQAVLTESVSELRRAEAA